MLLLYNIIIIDFLEELTYVRRRRNNNNYKKKEKKVASPGTIFVYISIVPIVETRNLPHIIIVTQIPDQQRANITVDCKDCTRQRALEENILTDNHIYSAQTEETWCVYLHGIPFQLARPGIWETTQTVALQGRLLNFLEVYPLARTGKGLW